MVASAGGLEAFKRFFQAMPADSGMAFLVVPHLDPRHESLMVGLLGKYTGMPVVEATEGVGVEPNRVYVIPPNRYLAVTHGVLRLTGPVERRAQQTAIDFFLRSLAEDQQENAICIILSGTGSHGSLGLKAIKANGGMAIVQEPRTAEYDQMPRAAIGTGLADFMLAPERMPEALLEYAAHFLAGTAGLPESSEVPDDLTQVLSLLRTRSRLDFRPYRKRMLLRRVQRRMGLRHVERLADYLGVLRADEGELDKLAKDLLISVTSFFRDPEMFEVLETQVIPELLRDRPADAALRVWVPGCATGEEAYSIAMLLIEQLAASHTACPLQIFATDLDADALEVARRGVYPASIQEDVTPGRLARFFTRVDEHSYQVTKQLREPVLIAQQNMLSDAPFSRLDLISCRNLLIYLEPEVQQKALTLLHFALSEGGCLVLGPSESVGRRVDLFALLSKKWRIYRRVGLVRPERVDFPIAGGWPSGGPGIAGAAATGRPVSLKEITQDLLLEDHAPAAVLIDRNYEILYYYGPTATYLEQPSGVPTRDLVSLARSGLGSRIRAAVHKAMLQGERVSLGGIRVKRDGQYVHIRIGARPVRAPRAADALLLVTFEDETVPRRVQRGAKEADASEGLVHHLEHELKSTREELQSAIEELESSNEELKASNEEVMSMNEELQSANEELETSKEELQSLNEELTTVNSQLQEKVADLEAAQNDIANLLRSADIETVFLGPDLTIKRFTSAATRLLNLIATDVGRPIYDIVPRFEDPDLRADLAAVLQNESTREKEVKAEDGRWYTRRIMPYRTLDGRVEGAVVAFSDVTALKHAEQELRRLAGELEGRYAQRGEQLRGEVQGRLQTGEALRAERDFVAAVLDTGAALVIVMDIEGRVVRVNKACEEASGYSFEELKGRTIWDLLLLPKETEAVRRTFAELRSGHFPNRLDHHWRHRDGSLRLIAWSNTCLLDEQGAVQYVIATGIDITERRYAEEEVRQRQSELAHLHRVYTAGELVTILAHEINQPLAAIASYSEASLQRLRQGEAAPDALIHDLEQTALQAQRAGRTIRELRSFLAKSEAGEARSELNAAVRTVHDLIGPEAGAKGVSIVLDLAEPIPPVNVSAVQVEHVLLNLIRNAIQAIGETGARAGTITVRTRTDAAQTAQVTVRDTGPGLGAEAAERVFEPFYTTKPDGLGMGLRISRSIVDSHGGRVWAEPSAEGGIFHFTLPFAP
jgi:two-component system CheB/CheR fusion protein